MMINGMSGTFISTSRFVAMLRECFDPRCYVEQFTETICEINE